MTTQEQFKHKFEMLCFTFKISGIALGMGEEELEEYVQDARDALTEVIRLAVRAQNEASCKEMKSIKEQQP